MSHGTCETVRIKADKSDDNPQGFVVINKDEFDKETMKLFTGKVEEVETPTESTTPASTEGSQPWLIKP